MKIIVSLSNGKFREFKTSSRRYFEASERRIDFWEDHLSKKVKKLEERLDLLEKQTQPVNDEATSSSELPGEAQ